MAFSTALEITDLNCDEINNVAGGAGILPGGSTVYNYKSFGGFIHSGWDVGQREAVAKKLAAIQAYKAANPDSYDPRADFLML